MMLIFLLLGWDPAKFNGSIHSLHSSHCCFMQADGGGGFFIFIFKLCVKRAF